MARPLKPLVAVLATGLGILLFACLIFSVAAPFIHQSREAARLEESKVRLRDQTFAAHAFHDQHGHFPPRLPHERTGPPHAWQTELLPFIDRAPLYGEIDFTQVWDAEANRRPFATRVEMYLQPAIPRAFDKAGYALTHYAGNIRVMRPEGGLPLAAISDDDPTRGDRGKSYTLLIGEIVAGLKPWGHPENLRDPALGLDQGDTTFGAPSPRGVQFALVDGSVRLIARDIAPQILRELADPTDGARRTPPGDGSSAGDGTAAERPPAKQ